MPTNQDDVRYEQRLAARTDGEPGKALVEIGDLVKGLTRNQLMRAIGDFYIARRNTPDDPRPSTPH